MLSDSSLRPSQRCWPSWRLNALSSIVCFLTKYRAEGPLRGHIGSQCPLEHCMLSDGMAVQLLSGETGGLNALSSIVCFLTNLHSGNIIRVYKYESQCPLEHCMLSDSMTVSIICFKLSDTSQCPLEHCMLSDLNVGRQGDHSERSIVSMPSRALYAF